MQAKSMSSVELPPKVGLPRRVPTHQQLCDQTQMWEDCVEGQDRQEA